MSTKIKIAYIITSSGIGGAEKILYHTVIGLDCNKYQISVCSLKEKGEVAKELEKHGVDIYCLHMANREGWIGWLASAGALFRLLLYLKRLRPAIIHSFLFRANILSRIAGYLIGVPIVISSIRVMGGEKGYFHFSERMTSFMVDRYIAVSESVERYIIQKSKIPERKISVIYNGVEVKNHTNLKVQNAKLLFNIEAKDNIVVTVGRLHRQKGYSYLLHAISKVKEKFPRIKLMFIGKGGEKNSLKNLAESLDLTDQVVFAGLRSDVENVLSTAELFVLPSLWEGMPNALLEAMAAGKAVVATRVGGIPELVIHEKTGILVPPEDFDALADAIIDLLQDKVRAKKMGEAGRVRVEEHFNISETLKKTENLYQELLKEKQLL